MSLLYTPDGYRYPSTNAPENNWNWIKNPGSWKNNRSANDFLAEMGERAMPGFKGFVAKYVGKGFKWIASLLGGLIALVPGLQILGGTIIAAVQTGVTGEIEKQLVKGLNEAVKTLGVNQYISNVKQMIFVPSGDHQTLTSKWKSLSGHAQSIVIHYVVNRWDWGYNDIMSLKFETVEGQKHFTTLLIALVCFPNWSWNISDGWGGREREFFAGEGVAKHLCHYADPPRWNPNSQPDLEKMRNICLLISTIEISHSEKEVNDFIESHKEPPPQEGKIGADLIIGGLVAAKTFKLF